MTMRILKPLFLTLFLATASFLTAADDPPTYVWWEAEEPASKTHAVVENHEPDSEYGAVLSHNGLLKPASGNEMLSATYQVQAPKAGTYNLWVRKWWKHGPFKWRFNEGDWNEVGRDIALHSSSFIALHIGANWVYLGEVELPEGSQTFEIQNTAQGGFYDCFLLIDGLFQPAGRLKPGEKSGNAEDGYFAWEPGGDPFTGESAIDLRGLNEEYAGVNGYVRREGDKFVLGDGTPVRFWLTQSGGFTAMQPRMMDVHARRLAKYGVNMVRLYFLGMFKTWRAGDEADFQKQLDRTHRAVAALKKEGVYTFFGHMFWDTHVESLSDDDLPGLKKGERPVAALFFNEPLQQYYLEFVKAVMLPENPYTRMSLAEDPAVAVIEVQNESNSLFWTFTPDRLAPHTRQLAQKAFAEFAAEKHGSLEKALEHWGDEVNGDDVEAGRAGVLPAWNMTSEGYQQHPKRARDQMEFLTKAQYDTYAFFKKTYADLGIKKMVAGSNWKTADPSTLGPLEHYSYTATDMVCRNEYFSPEKIEDSRGYAVDLNDVFIPRSAMRSPQTAGPLMTAHQAEWPYLITENNWDNPNPYRAEWPFLVATYGAMAGVDAWNFFSYDIPMWVSQLDVWNTNSPVIFGQYPALALMYRRGDVTEGDPAVFEHVKPESLYNNEPVALPEQQYKDFVWKAELGGDPTVDFESKIDPRAFFTGPVRLDLHSGKSEIETADLAELIDGERGVIRNTNGQLLWNYGKGHVIVNTPRSQGATGFLKEAGALATADLTIESANDYGTIVAVSLDDKPLKESGKILLQAVTQEKLYGYRTEEVDAEKGAVKITNLGGYPMNVKKIDATVTLRGLAGRKVTALDELGYPTEKPVQTQTEGKDLVITLPEDGLYTLVH